MRPENQAMKDYLERHGIKARVKYIRKGSLKGCWSLYAPGVKWTEDLAKELAGLGFRDFDGRPLGKYSGNGGVFSIHARKV